jgi:hypothetical protein
MVGQKGFKNGALMMTEEIRARLNTRPGKSGALTFPGDLQATIHQSLFPLLDDFSHSTARLAEK